jgi:hypothetical protein
LSPQKPGGGRIRMQSRIVRYRNQMGLSESSGSEKSWHASCFVGPARGEDT